VLALRYSDKIPEKNSLKEGRFILAHGFRDFSPLSLAPLLLKLVKMNIRIGRVWWSKAAHPMTDRRDNVPNDLLPLSRSHLLKFLPLSIIHSAMNPSMDKSIDDIRALMIQSALITAESGSKPSTHEPLGDISDPNHNKHLYSAINAQYSSGYV
jgi:hypothetical protein